MSAAVLAPAAAEPRSPIPFPRPRPAEAPKTEPRPQQEAAPAQSAEETPPPPSACRLALTGEIAIAPSIPPIKGPGDCGGEDLVRLEAVVLEDKSRVSLKPAATLTCNMATAVAEWVRTEVSALASALGTAVNELDNFDSFDCRGRNRVAGARLSEHGKANAIDIRSLKFADGRVLSLTDRHADRSWRETMLRSACARFTTVLGPSSDWYHEDHIHLDLAARRNGYRICQWDVLDPLPAVAPLLPAARPDEAPPREAKAGTEQDSEVSAGQDVAPAPNKSAADAAKEKRATEQKRAAEAGGATEPAPKQPPKKKGRRPAAPSLFDLRKSF